MNRKILPSSRHKWAISRRGSASWESASLSLSHCFDAMAPRVFAGGAERLGLQLLMLRLDAWPLSSCPTGWTWKTGASRAERRAMGGAPDAGAAEAIQGPAYDAAGIGPGQCQSQRPTGRAIMRDLRGFFFTGAHPHKTAGHDIRLGISSTSSAAQRIGAETRLHRLNSHGQRRHGRECDFGIQLCLRLQHSWRTPTTPIPHEVKPRRRLCTIIGSDDEGETADTHARRPSRAQKAFSILCPTTRAPFHAGSGATTRKSSMNSPLPCARSSNALSGRWLESKSIRQPDAHRPTGAPDDFAEHMQMLTDMLVLAFRMDLTRISTFMVGADGGDRTYRSLGPFRRSSHAEPSR